MDKHTPTPWEVGKIVDSQFPEHHTVYINIRNKQNQRIAAISVYGKQLDGKAKMRKGVYGLELAPNITGEECEANAAFIAALSRVGGPALRVTRQAITGLIDCNFKTSAEAALNSILSEFPDDL